MDESMNVTWRLRCGSNTVALEVRNLKVHRVVMSLAVCTHPTAIRVRHYRFPDIVNLLQTIVLQIENPKSEIRGESSLH